MSTRGTIIYGEDHHIYTEMFDAKCIYVEVRLDKHEGYLELNNEKLTFSLPPDLLTKIAEGWIKNKDKVRFLEP